MPSSIDYTKHLLEDAAMDAALYLKDKYSQRSYVNFCEELNLNPDPNLELLYRTAYLNGALCATREIMVNGSFNAKGCSIPTKEK